MAYNLAKYREVFSTDKVDTSLDIGIGFVAVNEHALDRVLENKIAWNTVSWRKNAWMWMTNQIDPSYEEHR